MGFGLSIVQWRTIWLAPASNWLYCRDAAGAWPPMREGKSPRMSTLWFGEAWRVSQQVFPVRRPDSIARILHGRDRPGLCRHRRTGLEGGREAANTWHGACLVDWHLDEVERSVDRT